jgi:hypothetical protein
MKVIFVILFVLAAPIILFAALPIMAELVPLAIIMLLIGGAGAMLKRSF